MYRYRLPSDVGIRNDLFQFLVRFFNNKNEINFLFRIKKSLRIVIQVIHSVLHYVISTVMEGVCIQLIKASHREFQRLKVVTRRDATATDWAGFPANLKAEYRIYGEFGYR
jgi:hypothetical protein